MPSEQDYQDWADWEDYQKSLSPAPQPEGSAWDAIPSLGDVGSAAWGMVKGIPSIPSHLADAVEEGAGAIIGSDIYTGEPFSGERALGDLYKIRDAAATMTMIPSAVTAARSMSEENYTPQQARADLRGELAAAPFQLGLATLPSIKNVAKGTYQATRDAVMGLPEESRLAAASGSDEILANTLNVGKSGASKAEDALLQRAGGQNAAFVEANPVKGIDPSTGRAGFEQFESNLGSIKVQSVNTRNNILSQASEREAAMLEEAQAAGQQIKAGIAFDDLPSQVLNENGLTYGLDKIRNTIPEGEAGVAQAENFLKQEFGIQESYPYGKTTTSTQYPYNEIPNEAVIAPSRQLSLTDANLVRQRIDGQIREWGGFDDNYLAVNQISPSARTGYIEAMKFYRGQLDSAIKGKLSDLVGSAAATAFDKAGKSYSMASTYEDFAGRFKRETGQAFTPGSAKQTPPGVGVLGTPGMTSRVMQSILPGTAQARMQTEALAREGNAIANLQALVDYKSGLRSMPAPRGWAQIKTSSEHLNMIGTAAMQLGLIRSLEDLTNAPDSVAKKIVGMVAQQAPQLFQPTPDKVNVIDNQYQDPMGKDIVMEDSKDLSPSERAKRIGGIWENKYVPPSGAIASLPSFSETSPDLDMVFNSLDGSYELAPDGRSYEAPSIPQGFDMSYNKESDTMDSQFWKATHMHDSDF